MKKIYILLACALLLSSICQAQVIGTKNLSQARNYETVILTSAAFPVFNDVSPDQLYLYSFHDTGTWEAIPFQIDERETPDGLFNGVDELLFLAQDLGDKVSLGNWLDDNDAQANNRYEIEVVDRRDETKKGWCYLFQSGSLTATDRSPVSYLTYVDSSVVNGKYYTMKRESGKFYPYEMAVTAEGGGNGTDIYDRTKLRILAIPFPGIEIALDEDKFVVDSTIFVNEGPIRIEHRLKLNLDIPDLEYGATFTLKYFPYSTNFHGRVELQDGWHFKLLRMSYDLNDATAGMKFFSGDSSGLANDNIPIDGSSDAAALTTALAGNAPSWTMATGSSGTPGSMLTLNNIEYVTDALNTEPYTQLLYYVDDAAAEDPLDTGDKVSFGDHGMIFESDDLVGIATYNSETYMLAPNQSTAFAQDMFYNFNTSMMVNPRAQNYAVDVDFKQIPGHPKSYKLNANYPNPFNPSTTISFEIPASNAVQLRIYDIQGHLVTTLLDQELEAGIYRQIWNGKNQHGKLVSTGVYFYRIKAGQFSDTGKMIFAK